MSNNDVFLSVIIPVYNVEKYLSQCIDSVLGQHLDNYEIILVDDGSPDRCPEICDAYAEKHPEIHVIHQKNGGLSAARNAGMMAATGEYIIFMDSDDWWNPEVSMHEVLQNVKSKRDVQMFLFTSLDYIEGEGYYKRKEHERLQNIRTDSVENYYHDLAQNGNFEVSACTKILNREYLLKNCLTFKNGMLGEDNHWIIRVLRCVTKVDILNEPIYICRLRHGGSITQTIKKKNVEDLLKIVAESIAYCEKSRKNLERCKYELCFCSYLWFSALGLSEKLPSAEKTQLMPMFNNTASVLAYSNSPKTKLAYTVYSLFGIRMTSIILGFYIRLKGKTNFNKGKVANI